MKAKPQDFNKVSEWLKAGGMSLDVYQFENPLGETEKAIAFECIKFTAAANPYKTKGWMAKVLVQKVENDFYTNGPAEMYLVPGWLIRKEKNKGVNFAD